MKNSLYFKGLRLWVEGLLLLALRWAQLKSGFDPETGLSLRSVPGLVLAAVLILLIIGEAALCFRMRRGKYSYDGAFRPMEKQDLPMLAAGILLLAGGSLLLGAAGLAGGGMSALAIAAAVMGVLAAGGLLLFVKQVRSGEGRVLPLLPAMVFSVLFLLLVYLPEESNPVLARYYLPVLAAAVLACAFYQLAGFACREASLRWFLFFGDLAVPFSLAALADSSGNWGKTLACGGCAMVLTVFLVLRRAEPQPEPAEESGEDTEDE